MPTRTEAAEALFRAAQGIAADLKQPLSQAELLLLVAIDHVKTATPDPILAERDRLQAEVERLRGALRDAQDECNRCLNVQGVPVAETPTTHGYGKILDIAARSLLASGDAR